MSNPPTPSPPNPWNCCPLCKFNKAVKTSLISSAVTSFIIGIPLTVAGAIMLDKANKKGEGKAGSDRSSDLSDCDHTQSPVEQLILNSVGSYDVTAGRSRDGCQAIRFVF